MVWFWLKFPRACFYVHPLSCHSSKIPAMEHGLPRSLVVKFGWKWSPNKKVLGVSMRKFRSKRDQKRPENALFWLFWLIIPHFRAFYPFFQHCTVKKIFHTTPLPPKNTGNGTPSSSKLFGEISVHSEPYRKSSRSMRSFRLRGVNQG